MTEQGKRLVFKCPGKTEIGAPNKAGQGKKQTRAGVRGGTAPSETRVFSTPRPKGNSIRGEENAQRKKKGLNDRTHDE